jgi:hypothetical protein
MTTAMIPFGIVSRPLMLRTLAAFLACAAFFQFTAVPAKALPAYDGLWSVPIVTEKGDCDRDFRFWREADDAINQQNMSP